MSAPPVDPPRAGFLYPGVRVGLVWGAVLAWLWPTRVVVRGDDFGYLESVVAAIKVGLPAGSDWVEPLNLVLPLLAAGVWRVSGSFYLATWGLTAVIALLNLVLLWRWLRRWLPPGWAGDGAVLALALGPVILNKTVEFTGVPLGLTLWLGALLAWRARRAGWFFALVLVGFLNRQSAVCLLALPVVDQLGAWRRGARIEGRWLIGTAVAAVVVAATMGAMPANFARELAARPSPDHGVLRLLGQGVLGAGLLAGIAAGWSLWRGEVGIDALRRGRARPWPVLGWLAAGAGVLLAGTVELRCETPGFWRLGGVAVFAAFTLAAALPDGWRRVEPALLAAAGLFGALVAWRGIWWDYYLVEPALLLAGAQARDETGGRPVSLPLARGATVVLLGGALLWLPQLRWQLAWAESRVVAYEEALRANRVAVTEISEAPFGFLGWKAFAAWRAAATPADQRLSDFLKLVEAGRSFYREGRVVVVPPAAERRSLHPAGELRAWPAGRRAPRFPLTDAEWAAWLREPSP